METRFAWDQAKAEANFRKHKLRFQTAVLAFADPGALCEQDRVENGEMRWQTLGKVNGRLLLLVAHAIWDDDSDGVPVEFIRIISARVATRRERQRYERENL